MERYEKERDMSRWRRATMVIGAIAATVVVAVGCSVANKNEVPPSAPQTSMETPQTSPEEESKYPWHQNVTATKFWIGEDETAANDYISNVPTYWMDNAAKAFGGVDDPNNRCENLPCSFTPNENAFYFALPAGDYNENGPKSPQELSAVPWYDGRPLKNGESLFKNRWIEVSYNGKTAYAQWEDVGPFNENDFGSVFGTDPSKDRRAGLDLSPATADYLEFGGADDIGTENGRAVVSWRFIDASEVPEGPWKKVVTTSGPQWGN